MSQTTEPEFLRPYSSLTLALRACGPQSATVLAWLRWWHTISSTPYSVSDSSVAERKLAWWAKAITLAFEIPPQHPMLRAVAPGTGVLTGPPIDLWLSQVHAMTQLCGQTRWLDEATLNRHIEGSTGAACQSVAWLMGSRDDHTMQIAKDLGHGLRRVSILARLGQDARHGWLHVPVDWLQRHNVKAHALLRPAAAPHDSDMQQLLDNWAENSRMQLTQAIGAARQLARADRRALKPLVVLSKLHLQLLDDLQRQRYPMLQQRLSVGPWRKLWNSHKTSWTWF